MFKVLNLSSGIFLYSVHIWTEVQKDIVFPTREKAQEAIDKILGFNYLSSECKPIKEHFEIIDMFKVN